MVCSWSAWSSFCWGEAPPVPSTTCSALTPSISTGCSTVSVASAGTVAFTSAPSGFCLQRGLHCLPLQKSLVQMSSNRAPHSDECAPVPETHLVPEWCAPTLVQHLVCDLFVPGHQWVALCPHLQFPRVDQHCADAVQILLFITRLPSNRSC